MDFLSLCIIGAVVCICSLPFPVLLENIFGHLRLKKDSLTIPNTKIIFLKTPVILALGYALDFIKGMLLFYTVSRFAEGDVGLQLICLSVGLILSLRSPWTLFRFQSLSWVAAWGMLSMLNPVFFVAVPVIIGLVTLLINNWLYGIVIGFFALIFLVLNHSSDIALPLAIATFTWVTVMYADHLFGGTTSYGLIELYKRRK